MCQSVQMRVTEKKGSFLVYIQIGSKSVSNRRKSGFSSWPKGGQRGRRLLAYICSQSLLPADMRDELWTYQPANGIFHPSIKVYVFRSTIHNTQLAVRWKSSAV